MWMGGLDISHELVETLAAGDVQPPMAMVGVVLDDLHIVGRCVLLMISSWFSGEYC